MTYDDILEHCKRKIEHFKWFAGTNTVAGKEYEEHFMIAALIEKQNEHDAEIRRKTIDEFLNRVEDEGDCGDWIEINKYYLEKIAEQMKGETE